MSTATLDRGLYAVEPPPTQQERLGILLRLRRAARRALDAVLALPRGAAGWVLRHTRTILSVLGSKVGQVTFNLRKGSIPARTDVDTSKFDVYMKDAARDFSGADSLVGSAPHGSATNEAFASALNTAINTFVANPEAAAEAATTLVTQAEDLLK